MHIAIIGAGISGLLTALELVEQGCSVHLFDQQQPGHAASWAGGGILSPMYPWRYPQAVNTLAQHGKSLYQQYNEKLAPQTGIDFQIHETGMLIFDQADFHQGMHYATDFHEPMQYCESVQRERLLQLNPHISAQFQQAMYFPQLANVRNPRLLKSLLAYLQQHPKVTISTNCWIDQFHITQHKIHSIQAQNGQKFSADQVVIATGAWSAHWSAQLGCSIPVKPVQGQMILFKTPAQWLPTMCMNNVMYLIPRMDGHVVCGSSTDHLGFEHRPNIQTTQHIFKACTEMVPELANFPIVKQWAGLRPGSDSGIPYIGKMPDLDNVWANFGHYRNGLCMGPGSARLLRQLMLDQATIVDPVPYQTDRLSAL